jgi:hypothetical protein
MLFKNMKTEYKGEKHIYFLMAYNACKSNNGGVVVGKDNGMVGGQNYYRAFHIQNYNGKILLIERKNNKAFADFSRIIEVIEYSSMPKFRDYINENGENGSKTWIH